MLIIELGQSNLQTEATVVETGLATSIYELEIEMETQKPTHCMYFTEKSSLLILP